MCNRGCDAISKDIATSREPRIAVNERRMNYSIRRDGALARMMPLA